MENQGHFMMHKAWMMVLLGVLILINATWHIVSWALFIGFITVIFGILSLIVHGCCCCKNNSCKQETNMPMKKK